VARKITSPPSRSQVAGTAPTLWFSRFPPTAWCCPTSGLSHEIGESVNRFVHHLGQTDSRNVSAEEHGRWETASPEMVSSPVGRRDGGQGDMSGGTKTRGWTFRLSPTRHQDTR